MSEDGQEDADDVSSIYDGPGNDVEVEQWFNNTHQQGAAQLSGKLARWFWDRQAALINRKVARGRKDGTETTPTRGK